MKGRRTNAGGGGEIKNLAVRIGVSNLVRSGMKSGGEPIVAARGPEIRKEEGRFGCQRVQIVPREIAKNPFERRLLMTASDDSETSRTI